MYAYCTPFFHSVLIVMDKISSAGTGSDAIDMEFRKKIYECKNDSFYELIQCIMDRVRNEFT